MLLLGKLRMLFAYNGRQLSTCNVYPFPAWFLPIRVEPSGVGSCFSTPIAGGVGSFRTREKGFREKQQLGRR